MFLELYLDDLPKATEDDGSEDYLHIYDNKNRPRKTIQDMMLRNHTRQQIESMSKIELAKAKTKAKFELKAQSFKEDSLKASGIDRYVFKGYAKVYDVLALAANVIPIDVAGFLFSAKYKQEVADQYVKNQEKMKKNAISWHKKRYSEKWLYRKKVQAERAEATKLEYEQTVKQGQDEDAKKAEEALEESLAAQQDGRGLSL